MSKFILAALAFCTAVTAQEIIATEGEYSEEQEAAVLLLGDDEAESEEVVLEEFLVDELDDSEVALLEESEEITE